MTMHAVDVPGAWKKTNNAGRELCKGFQRGSCLKALNGYCSKNPKHAHQCAICLDNRHGAESCPRKTQDAGDDKKTVRRKKRKGGKQ